MLIGSWRLVEPAGNPEPEVGTIATLVIREDGAVAGSSGVNRFMSRLESDALSDGRIGFGPPAGTKMAGPPEAMELERTFLERLETVSTYAVEGDILRLFAGDTEVLRFERATP